MPRQMIWAALAAVAGTVLGCASASAHGDRYGYYESYSSYEEPCDCDGYRDYGYRDYGYRDYRHRHYGYREYRPSRYGQPVHSGSYYSDFGDYSNYTYHLREPRDRRWRPEDYPAGERSWWNRMDREGRGGRQ